MALHKQPAKTWSQQSHLTRKNTRDICKCPFPSAFDLEHLYHTLWHRIEHLNVWNKIPAEIARFSTEEQLAHWLSEETPHWPRRYCLNSCSRLATLLTSPGMTSSFRLIQLVLFVLFLDTKENLAHSRHCSVMSFVVSNPHIVCLVATTDQIHISVLGLSQAQLCCISCLVDLLLSERNTAWMCFQAAHQKEHKGVDTSKMFVHLDTRELWKKCSRLEHRTVKHNLVTHISRHQESVEQLLQDVHITSRNQKLSTRFQKNLFSFENIRSTTPRAYTPKAHAVQTLQRWKDLQRLLVDHNYQIEHSEIQQRSNNTTYAILIHIDNRDPTVSTHSRIQSSLAYRFFLSLSLCVPTWMSIEVHWLDLEEYLSSHRTRQGSSFTLTLEMSEQTSVISKSATSRPLSWVHVYLTDQVQQPWVVQWFHHQNCSLQSHSAVWLNGLHRRFTPNLSSSHALLPGVGSQPASSLVSWPSINQGTRFIAS